MLMVASFGPGTWVGRVLGLAMLTIGAVAVPARADDAEAARAAFERFDRQFIHRTESLPTDPPPGVARHFSMVGGEASFSSRLVQGSFIRAYQVYLLRGLSFCDYLKDPEAVRRNSPSLTLFKVVDTLTRSASVLPIRGIAMEIEGFSPVGRGIQAVIAFRTPSQDKPIFKAEAHFLRQNNEWTLDFPGFMRAIDRYWSQLADLYGAQMPDGPDAPPANLEGRRLYAALSLALAETLSDLQQSCPEFQTAYRAASINEGPRSRLAMVEGLRQLLLTPLRGWPRPNQLDWWAEQKL